MKNKTLFFALALLWACALQGQTTSLFFGFADSTKKDLVIGSQTLQTQSFGKDTASALKMIQGFMLQLEQDSASLVARFRDNRNQYAQAKSIVAALTPKKPGEQAPTKETPEQTELRLLREENARLKQQHQNKNKNK